MFEPILKTKAYCLLIIRAKTTMKMFENHLKTVDNFIFSFKKKQKNKNIFLKFSLNYINTTKT